MSQPHGGAMAAELLAMVYHGSHTVVTWQLCVLWQSKYSPTVFQ